MRVFRIRGGVVGAAFSQQSGCPGRIVQATKIFSPISKRYQSNLSEGGSSGQWTQHTLKPPSVFIQQSSIISKASSDAAKKHTAYIAFGSNLGDRVDWIEKAFNEMLKRGIKVKRTSSLWETEPMYVTDQGSFINGACEVSFNSVL